MSKTFATVPPSSLELGSAAALAHKIAAFVLAKVAVRRSRRDLAALSDQMLADAGIEASLARPSSRYEVSARTMTHLMSLR
jgi:uncharacterized protein YjiS (DUF1127 family)